MAAKDEGNTRDARLKAALRDNLKRRKQAARQAAGKPRDDGPQQRSSDPAESKD